jgi:hypothetical protein
MGQVGDSNPLGLQNQTKDLLPSLPTEPNQLRLEIKIILFSKCFLQFEQIIVCRLVKEKQAVLKLNSKSLKAIFQIKEQTFSAAVEVKKKLKFFVLVRLKPV